MKNITIVKLLASDPAGYDAIKGNVLKSLKLFCSNVYDMNS